MMGMGNEATLLVSGENFGKKDIEGWEYKSNEFLLEDLSKIIESKKASGTILQGLLLIIAMSVVLWNTGLLGGLRRYSEFGVRLLRILPDIPEYIFTKATLKQ